MLSVTLRIRTPEHVANQTIRLAALLARDHVTRMRRVGIDGTLTHREERIIHSIFITNIPLPYRKPLQSAIPANKKTLPTHCMSRGTTMYTQRVYKVYLFLSRNLPHLFTQELTQFPLDLCRITQEWQHCCQVPRDRSTHCLHQYAQIFPPWRRRLSPIL